MFSRIESILPELLNDEIISGYFTLRNHTVIHPEAEIAGLNLGLNTNEAREVIMENRAQLLNHLGIAPDKIAMGIQVHKTDVKYIDKGGVYPDTDAFVTDVPGLALSIQVADCAAILLGDGRNKVIAAAHAGWRGAADGIVSKTISGMQEKGAQPAHIKAFISPCISLAKFEVGEETAARFPSEFVDYTSYQKPHVDLKKFIRHELLKAGILEQHIETDAGCTVSEERFYSYRRQKDMSGRMLGIIKLNG